MKKDLTFCKEIPHKPYNIVTPDRFGVHCVINYEKNFKLGRGSTYNDYCWFNARFGIVIGENTLIGPRVLIHSANHVIKNIDIEQNANGPGSWAQASGSMRVTGKPVTIGNDVWIGANVTILAGSRIPDKCVIGAGTIITESNSQRLNCGDIVVNELDLRILGNRKDYK